MDDYMLDMSVYFGPTSARSENVSDETLKFFIEELDNENGPSIQKYKCVFIGTFCKELHIVPVAILPGVRGAEHPHDLDLFRWVPFYTELTYIDIEENLFTVKIKQDNVSYSFYHAPQRLGRDFNEPNALVAALLGHPCDPWYGNMLVIKTIDEGNQKVIDIEESELKTIRTILITALTDGIGVRID